MGAVTPVTGTGAVTPITGAVTGATVVVTGATAHRPRQSLRRRARSLAWWAYLVCPLVSAQRPFPPPATAEPTVVLQAQRCPSGALRRSVPTAPSPVGAAGTCGAAL